MDGFLKWDSFRFERWRFASGLGSLHGSERHGSTHGRSHSDHTSRGRKDLVRGRFLGATATSKRLSHDLADVANPTPIKTVRFVLAQPTADLACLLVVIYAEPFRSPQVQHQELL